MVRAELLAAGLELVLGNVEGISVAVSLLVAAHYIGEASALALLLQHLRIVAGVFLLVGVAAYAGLLPGVRVSLDVGTLAEVGGRVWRWLPVPAFFGLGG